MNIETFDGAEDFLQFVETCKNSLFYSDKYEFKFPKNCSSKNWQPTKIKKENTKFLEELKDNANVYAIFIRSNNLDEWKCQYIGQRKSNKICERITQHFIKKHEKTNSKLKEIKAAVDAKKEISVSFIKINPEPLRLFVEAMIIDKHKETLEWNKNR